MTKSNTSKKNFNQIEYDEAFVFQDHLIQNYLQSKIRNYIPTKEALVTWYAGPGMRRLNKYTKTFNIEEKVNVLEQAAHWQTQVHVECQYLSHWVNVAVC